MTFNTMMKIHISEVDLCKKKKKDLLSEQPHVPLKLLILDTKMMSEDWYLHL